MSTAAKIASLLVLTVAVPAASQFVCGAAKGPPVSALAAKASAAPQISRVGTRNALVIFVAFSDTPVLEAPPTWSADFFASDTPGSFSHYYDSMSGGLLQIRGDIATEVFRSQHPADTYVADSPHLSGRYGEFVVDIMSQVDARVDFRRFDNDGPDAVPDSGDDDGIVDAVFLVLADMPANFLQGAATGIANLGLRSPITTNDMGSSGQVQIVSQQGAVLLGRNFAEAVGVACHEFGHLLGLPDLFDTGFQRASQPLPPERDSAGIGAWGLMGWGALGWHGDDGPTGMSAWSREFLGWARVHRLTSAQETVALADVGKQGDIFELPLSARERFLFEYRSRRSSHYDRNIPGEGLLIWHDQGSSLLAPYVVDLETADGRWLDSGYPLGRVPAPLEGEDNLDFWAHDTSYATSHGGNLGDATDPFDGVRFRNFTPETNPSSYDSGGQRSVRVENIQVTGDSLRAVISTVPASLRLSVWALRDANGDRILSPGEDAELTLRVANRGGVPLSDVTVHIRSLDPLVSLSDTIIHFDDVQVDHTTGPPRTSFPKILAGDFDGRRQVQLAIRVTSAQTAPLDTIIQLEAVATFTFSGRVLSDSGDSVAGTRIITASPGSYTFATDDDGSFAISMLPNTYYLNIFPPAPYVRTFQPLRLGADTRIDIIVLQGVSFSGVVADTSGTPVVGASVRVGNESSQTDSQGRFTLLSPPGNQTIQITPFPSNLPPLAQTISVTADAEFVFVLKPGVLVDVSFDTGASYTSLLSYLIGLDGSVGVVASGRRALFRAHPGLHSLNLLNDRNGTGLTRIIDVQTDTMLTVRVPRRQAVSGTLIDVASLPNLSSDVIFHSIDAPATASSEVGGDGEFSASLSDGSYAVGLDRGTGSMPGQWLDTIRVHDTTTVTLTPRDGSPFTGQFVMASGDPAGNAQVRLLSRQTMSWSDAVTDALGRFETWALPGSYGLSVRRDSLLYWLSEQPLQSVTHLSDIGVTGRLSSVSAFATPPLVTLVDDPRSPVSSQSAAVQFPRHFLLATAPATGAFVGASGSFQLPGRQRFVVALPARGRGVGRVLDLQSPDVDPMAIVIDLPSTRLDTLYGTIETPAPANIAGSVLRLYDAGAAIVAQTTVFAGTDFYHLPVPAGEYEARLSLLDPHIGFGAQYDLGTVSVSGNKRWNVRLTDVMTAVSGQTTALPEHPVLSQNFPNPFNAATTIPFVVGTEGHILISVFDVLGRRVLTLTDDQLPRGRHVVRWDGRDGRGNVVGSGLYFVRLQAAGRSMTRKALLIR